MARLAFRLEDRNGGPSLPVLLCEKSIRVLMKGVLGISEEGDQVIGKLGPLICGQSIRIYFAAQRQCELRGARNRQCEFLYTPSDGLSVRSLNLSRVLGDLLSHVEE